jgi:hypothetical protein
MLFSKSTERVPLALIVPPPKNADVPAADGSTNSPAVF